MFYLSGDTHGNQIVIDDNIVRFLKSGDSIIFTGDFGIGFLDGARWPEEMFLDYIGNQDIQIIFIDGNHENFNKLNSYPVSEWNGGKVHRIRNNIIHLMRGEVYTIEGNKIFVMGGGFSVDKALREDGKSWWSEEMPSENEYENARINLDRHNHKVDYILTHTAPIDTVEYMSRLNNSIKNIYPEETPLTGFLKWVEETTVYKRWFFGHFHIDMELWKSQIAMYNAIRDFKTGKLIKMRV